MNPDFPRSFQPREKPWITTEVASTEKIIAQVKKCQSEALSYFLDKVTQLKKKNLQQSQIIEYGCNQYQKRNGGG